MWIKNKVSFWCWSIVALMLLIAAMFGCTVSKEPKTVYKKSFSCGCGDSVTCDSPWIVGFKHKKFIGLGQRNIY